MGLGDLAFEYMQARRAVIEAERERNDKCDELEDNDKHACWREIGHESHTTAWCDRCKPALELFERVHALRARKAALLRRLDRAVERAREKQSVLVEFALSAEVGEILDRLIRLRVYGATREEVCERMVMRALQEHCEADQRARRSA